MVQVGEPVNLADFTCCPSDGHFTLLPVRPHASVDMEKTTNNFNCCASGIAVDMRAEPALQPAPAFQHKPQDRSFG